MGIQVVPEVQNLEMKIVGIEPAPHLAPTVTSKRCPLAIWLVAVTNPLEHWIPRWLRKQLISIEMWSKGCPAWMFAVMMVATATTRFVRYVCWLLVGFWTRFSLKTPLLEGTYGKYYDVEDETLPLQGNTWHCWVLYWKVSRRLWAALDHHRLEDRQQHHPLLEAIRHSQLWSRRVRSQKNGIVVNFSGEETVQEFHHIRQGRSPRMY